MLDGAAKINAMFHEAEQLGMPAIGVTDHGNMFGANEFYRVSQGYAVKPIIGIEAYVAPGSRFTTERVHWGDTYQKSDDISGSGLYTHMTMLAENEVGLRNLFTLSSLASLEGQVSKYPRMDTEIIAEHYGGIIATTGCPSGEVQTRLRLGQYDKAVECAGKWRDIFGGDNYFLEVMDHGLHIERRVREDLLRLGKYLGIAPVATNDCHYVKQSDADTHSALLCVQTGKTLSDPNRFKFDGDGYYVKTAQQMRAIWDREVPGACDNTLRIADRVQSYDNVWAPKDLMPVFPVPEGFTVDTWLRYETETGLERRFNNGMFPREYVDRCDYELNVIARMGFSSYFLIVADLVGFARRSGIWVGPGRGSAAGSVVAWALHIINVDPIRFDLIFERFLNPDRVSLPDIDIDFDDRRRSEMIHYANQKYGCDKVAQVITFGTIKTKAALKDAARVLYGQSGFAIADRISKVLPAPVMGKDIPLTGVYDSTHERYKEAGGVRELLESDPDTRKIYETALGLEGLIRNAGVHACAVVMSSEPLASLIPVWKRPADGAIITGWDYPACESIGLLKMDFLGLRNLTVIGDCVANIKTNRGVTIDVESLPLDDPHVFKLLSSGDTLGVFQLDSTAMRDLLRRLSPTCFEDIIAVVALYRPGPLAMNAHNDFADRKNGRQPITPIHPQLAEPLTDILQETYGLIVYQEQIMRIAQTVAGYTLAEADILRKAMGKKQEDVLRAEFTGFKEGMLARGYCVEAIHGLWDTILPFAGYAFNKSHAAGYAMISYWTAYLKANYPAEYMAALLTAVGDDKDKIAVYLADCRRLGVTVLPPDVNQSSSMFTAVGDDVRFGLASIRNVGTNVVDSIIHARTSKGDFTGFYDYLNKIDSKACSKRVTESLVKAGAFDSLGYSRLGLYLVHTDAVDAVHSVKKAEALGQLDLFEAFTTNPTTNTGKQCESVVGVNMPITREEWTVKEKLGFEREMLGLYVSGHPLHNVGATLTRYADTLITSVINHELPDDALITIAGVISGVTRKISKNGAAYATAVIEDTSGGIIEIFFFPDTYSKYYNLIVDDVILVIYAKVNNRDDKTVLMCKELSTPNLTPEQENKGKTVGLTIKIPIGLCVEGNIECLQQLLAQHPGGQRVYVIIESSEGTVTYSVDPNKYTVTVTESLLASVKHLFGTQSIEQQ